MSDLIQLKGAFDGSTPIALAEREPAIDFVNGRLFFGDDEGNVHGFYLSNMSDQEWAQYMAENYAPLNHTHSNYAATNHNHKVARWHTGAGRNHLRVRKNSNTTAGEVPVLDTPGNIKYMHWNGSNLGVQVDVSWLYWTVFFSDKNLKENITVIDSPELWDGALSAMTNIPLVSFDWKKEALQSGHERIGLIAQDLEAINPELVTTGADGLKYINEYKALMYLVACIKSLARRVEALEA